MGGNGAAAGMQSAAARPWEMHFGVHACVQRTLQPCALSLCARTHVDAAHPYPLADACAVLRQACQPRPEQAFRFAGQQAYRSCDTPEERDGWASRLAWDAATGQGGRSGGASGGGVPFWPPGAPGTQHDLTAHHPSGRGQAMPAQAAGPPAAGGGGAAAASEGGLAVELAGSMAGLCPLLHSLLRPAYLDPALLKQAVERCGMGREMRVAACMHVCMCC